MSNSMLGSLAGRRQGVGSTLRGCAYARQLADPLTSAREKLKSSRELLEKCSKEVGVMNSMGTGLGTHYSCTLLSAQASVYAQCVSSKANLKQYDCQEEFEALKQCMQRFQV